jgi:hypothetical protein
MTQSERRKAHSDLKKSLVYWGTLTDEQLLEEVKKGFPIISQATRHECLTMLVMDYTDKFLQ